MIMLRLERMNRKFRAKTIVLLSVIALGAVMYGLFHAMHSPLFLVRVVEIADQPEKSPVDAQTITDLAAVPVGKINLFDLSLAGVEKRILTNSWIKEVRLQKRFPQTVVISVTFREPKALIESDKAGGLAYVEKDGTIFGKMNLLYGDELPVLTGFKGQSSEKIGDALRLLDHWDEAKLSQISQIASISYDQERGLRALVLYPLDTGTGIRKARALVEFGPEMASDLEIQMGRLSQVFGYLSSRKIAARQIWADSGKKIVVKIAHGS